MNDSESPPFADQVHLAWPNTLSALDLQGVVNLIDFAAADGGTLGYATSMTASEAASFTTSLTSSVESGSTHALIGSAGDRYVFFCLMTPSAMPNCSHRAELLKGVVHPLYRGRSLIPRVFREIVSKAEALGIHQLVLDVREGSRAHLLWQRFGFQTYGVLDDYARFDKKSFRGHYMAQTVSSLRQRVFTQP